MELNHTTAFQKDLVARLRYGEEIAKYLRVPFQLTAMNFKCYGLLTKQNDVPVLEPDARADDVGDRRVCYERTPL